MLLTLVLLTAHVLAPQEVRQPNVLIVVADDLSERDLDRLNTPALDTLAARGLRFRRAYGNPTCSPSRWSIHFGQYHTKDAGPVCDGYDEQTAPSTALTSLPRVFSEAGYSTALFGKWHLGSFAGVQSGEPWEEAPRRHGYDTWRAGLAINLGICGSRNYRDWIRVDDGRSSRSSQYAPDAVRDAFLAWHAEQKSEHPWFAMVCFPLPHPPLHAPPGMERKGRELDNQEKFAAMVSYLDRLIGEIVSVVDTEHTLVVFVADNGSPRLAARSDRKDAKTTTFEGGIRIPMIWAGPGVPRGIETSSLVHQVDLLPTLAERIGRTIDSQGLDGISLVPLLANPQLPVREYAWVGLGPNKKAPSGDFCVVTARHKLRRVGTETFLFDLLLDPEETHDLAELEEYGELRGELEAQLERHLSTAVGPTPSSPPESED